MEKFVHEMHPFIHLRHFEPKPFATRMLKSSQPCQKTFSMSSLMTTPFCFFLSHSSMSLFAMRDASRICRPSTKVVCCPVIVKGRTFLRRFVTMIFYIVWSWDLWDESLQQCGHLVSLRSDIDNSVMRPYVSFRLSLITSFWKKKKKYWNTLMISALIKF